MTEPLNSTRNLLISMCDAFNRHDVDAVLTLMHSDVDWPDGMRGGRLRGHDEVRDYWTRMWNEVDLQIIPLMFRGSERSRKRENPGNDLGYMHLQPPCYLASYTIQTLQE